jgi:hypothetical protein
MAGQQQLWTQLEAFSRQVHGSLNPVEVAYLVANEGRRLIECDRVSVGVRRGRKVTIDAISGADVVEKRSNLVLLMRKLTDRVIKWGEKLVFTGTKDDALPPKVLEALDAYLAESASKLLVVQPLKDEREGESKRPARAALVMECFDPPPEPQQLIARLEVVARHATSSLYNAVEHRRIPMRFVWMPLAALQDGVGGKAKAITFAVVAGLSLLVAAMIVVPYPLKMESNGQLVPQVRRVVYSPVSGRIIKFDTYPGETLEQQRKLATLYDHDLDEKIRAILTDMDNARREAGAADQASKLTTSSPDRLAQEGKATQQRAIERAKAEQLAQLVAQTNADPENPGYYFLKAPRFTPEEASRVTRQEWTVLSSDFKSELTDRVVKPSEPILRVGAKDGHWEIELKIPQKHVGQILHAFERIKKENDKIEEENKRIDEENVRRKEKNQELRARKPLLPEVLDVDFLLRTDPTRKFKGRLSRDKIAGEAQPNKDDNNESEPVVIAYVRIDEGDIDPDYQLPPELLVANTEVRAKVRCGNHAMGYSLFYGVWEFLYENVVFFF